MSDSSSAPSGHAPTASAASGPVHVLLHRPAIGFLALLAAAFAIYAPALNARFLWDDIPLVRGNPFIRSPVLIPEAFRRTLFGGESNFYRPTQTLTFIADYWAWGLNPFGFHLTNILIHGFNAGLLFLVLRGTLPWVLRQGGTGSPSAEQRVTGAWIAFGTALVWAVHPVHSAAVAYVSGRADSLAMAFCLLAWLAFERAGRTAAVFARAGWGAAACTCLVLGLCSKEIAAIWLAIFLGVQIAFRPDVSRRQKWSAAAGAAAALLVYAILRNLPAPPHAPPPAPTLPAKWLLMIRALGDYGSLLVFPDKLFMERQVFAAPGLANPADAIVYTSMAFAGVILLAVFAAGAMWPGRGRTLRRFGAAWFMAGYLPVSNLFSLNASVAEHWLYLPSIGFLLFAAGAALDCPLPRARRLATALAAVALIAGALAARTYWRAFDWSDELTFFTQTIEDGGDVPRARDALAMAYSHAHNDAAAVALLRAISAKYPKVVSTRINLATALAREGHYGEARPILEGVLPLLLQNGNPAEIVVTVKALDSLESGSGWPERRRRLIEGALRQCPDSWELVQLAATDLENRQDPKGASRLVHGFAIAHWWSAAAHLADGRLDSLLGRPADALAAWEQAGRLDVHDAEAPAAAATLCLEEEHLDAARALGRQAVRREPDSPKQRLLFARILMRAGDPAGGAEQLAIARRLTGGEKVQ